MTRDRIDYDYVLLMLAPQVDLWRDINTRRDVGGDWLYYTVLPRFIVEDQELVLVPSPFVNMRSADFVDKNDWDPVLRRHLRTYDRFTFQRSTRNRGSLAVQFSISLSQWSTADFCEPGVWCIDLAENLLEIPGDQIDTGYDGTHFGPNVSRLIAELIENGLVSGGVLGPTSTKRR